MRDITDSMMTSSNVNIFRYTGQLCGEFTGDRWKGPVTRRFDVLFDLCLKKRLNEQSKHRLFETPSSSLWRHCSALDILSFLCSVQRWPLIIPIGSALTQVTAINAIDRAIYRTIGWCLLSSPLRAYLYTLYRRIQLFPNFMTTIWQTKSQNAVSWINIILFFLKFHQRFCLGVQVSITYQWLS